MKGPSAFSKQEKEKILWPAQSHTISPFHIARVQFQLNLLSDKLFHIARYRREDLDPLFCTWPFYQQWTEKLVSQYSELLIHGGDYSEK